MDKNTENTDKFIDKRLQPRYSTNFPARVKTSTGEIIDAVVTNISLSGLQLSGDDSMPFKLFADRHQQQKSGPAFFNIQFDVSTSTRTSATVDIDCQTVYIRRLSKDSTIAGCQFHSFNNQTEEYLADYITHFGQPL